ncbi:hypothetical protein JJE66_27990 [Bradyrhizobium diazoefficiens]|uniref:hypothetical protein n=1 Tax=Bradyrhizobium diazoefficiens TaxID=1355477 RepID=UPI00190B3E1D|nr:hypothetical protein [Bradyrhizobium diazoefficiens]MBK3665060.1 hypothetical protein [Bradyrhizobium diazoefficiens]
MSFANTVFVSDLRRGPARAAIVGLFLALLALAIAIDPSRAQQPTGTGETAGDASTGQAPAAGGATGQQKASTKDAAKASRNPVSDCAGGEVFSKLATTANSPAIIYNGNLVPAGSLVDFGLTSSLDTNGHYFALFLDDETKPRDNDGRGARARRAGDTDDLVARRLLAAGDTIVSVDVPASAAGFWTKRNLYIYQCDSTRRPFNVSYLPVYLSPLPWSIAIAVLTVFGAYFVAANAFGFATGQSLKGAQAWNPIRITASSDNRGSLSAFQVFFFTMLVFAMLAFVLLRIGILSDLSTTVLELLGISGIGAAAAKGADSAKTAIDPANEAWLRGKGWYDGPSVRAATAPSFYDLISSDGVFDVYRFQSLLFTAAVGAALFIGGVSQLSSFSVPANILGILGLSQVVYIAGKLVAPGTASQLNAVLTDLRTAEAEFRAAAFAGATPPGTSTGIALTLADAADRAGAANYVRYLDKAKGAAKLFTDLTGRIVDRPKLEPSLGTT